MIIVLVMRDPPTFWRQREVANYDSVLKLITVMSAEKVENSVWLCHEMREPSARCNRHRLDIILCSTSPSHLALFATILFIGLNACR